MADLLFRKGSVANIATAQLIPGAISITTDEPGIYLDLAATDAGAKGTAQRVRVGDFIPVANLQALKDRLAAGEKFSSQALYYAIEENMLLRFDGSKFAWINDQTALTARVDDLEAADIDINNLITANTNAINQEITDRTSAISGLQSQIDALTGVGGEGATSLAGLAAALAKEISDRETADAAHDSSIEDMSTDIGTNAAAITALQNLVGSLPSGVSGDIVTYLAGLVNAEAQIARAAEQANAEAIAGHTANITELTTNLNNEITRAGNAEAANALAAKAADDKAVAAQNAAQAEAERAIKKEGELNLAITGNTNAITELDNKIDNSVTSINNSISEVSGVANDAQSKANANAANLTQEIQDRNAAITQVRTDFAAADAVLQNAINEINGSIDDMASDINDNAKAISDETTRADAEEKRLAGLISSNSQAISKEIEDRAKAIADVTDLINSANNAHTGLSDIVTQHGKDIENIQGTNQIQGEQISANSKAISDEIARAKAAEQANAKAVSDETTRATQAEGQLRTDLNTEIADRKAADEETLDDAKAYADEKNAALKKIIEDNIAAANCMTFMGGVKGFTGDNALPVTNINGGDTYVVTAPFNNGTYQIGDLLVASADFTGTHTAGSADQIAFWTHVETGYSTWQDPKLGVEGNLIKLTSHLDEVLGTIEVKSISDNIVVSTTGTGTNCSVEVSFVWGAF